MYVRGMAFASFYDFSMWFWNCSESVVLFFNLFRWIFVFFSTHWYSVDNAMRQSVTKWYSQPTSAVLSIVYSSLYLVIITLIYIYIYLIAYWFYIFDYSNQSSFHELQNETKYKIHFPFELLSINEQHLFFFSNQWCWSLFDSYFYIFLASTLVELLIYN